MERLGTKADSEQAQVTGGGDDCPHPLLETFKRNVRPFWKPGEREWLCPDCGKFVQIVIEHQHGRFV